MKQLSKQQHFIDCSSDTRLLSLQLAKTGEGDTCVEEADFHHPLSSSSGSVFSARDPLLKARLPRANKGQQRVKWQNDSLRKKKKLNTVSNFRQEATWAIDG